ncbi:MAG: hypothetical protein ACPLXM_06065 [Bacteroidales bacterium]
MHPKLKAVPIYLVFLSMGMIDAVGPMERLIHDLSAISVKMTIQLFPIPFEKITEHIFERTGLMVSSIAGGAVLPPLTGLVADNVSITAAFIVPLFFIFYIVTLGIMNLRNK